MKKLIILAIVALTSTTAFAEGWGPVWDWEALGIEGELHGTVEVGLQSQYIWRGFEVYGTRSALQASVDLDLFQTGFGVSVTAHRANGGPMADPFERWDYNLYYQNALFQGEAYAVNYRLGWVYYNYPDQSCKDFDLQELHAIFSLPNALPIKGLVPTYVLVKLWPAYSNSFVGARSPFGGSASGLAHIFMLDYTWNVPGFLPEVPEQPIKFHGEVVYNDGVGPGGQFMDNDWSNAVLGVSTDFDLGYGIIITPASYYQRTMEPTLQALNGGDEDEFWATVSLKYKF